MSQCRWCGRDGWHDSLCPDYDRTDGFSQASAFHEEDKRREKEPPLLNVKFGEDGQLTEIQMLASSRDGLEEATTDLDRAIEFLEAGDIADGMALLDDIRRNLNDLLL